MTALVLDLEVRQGGFDLHVCERSSIEVLGIYGPSGAGKTTLLEAIAGLRRVEAGEIRVGERTVFSRRDRVDLPARERRIGYVPQDALLFPHLGVRRNLLYGAQADGVGELTRIAQMLEITPLLDRRVQGLSGGERQRIAIGRALMTRPSLLLLDEPLAGVDRARRERILPYLLRIRQESRVPMIYVTHDAGELSQIADRVLVLEEGRIVRAGPPVDVLHTA